ncbi:helix-turn-helix domain-containing protein [Enterobacter wuhouensis]|uniref:helix-turn-helix domain-containing protein n=1 Tax=Enterobacter wuhouensis TaxID=2529381 RepID=UPI003D77D56E
MTMTTKSMGLTECSANEAGLISTAQANRRFLSLEEIKRPTEALRIVHDALLPYSTPYAVRSNRHLLSLNGKSSAIWLVSSGNLSYYRTYDDLKIAISPGPVVAGLAELFAPFNRHVYRASRGAKVFSIPLERAREVITELQLWESVAEILGYVVQMMCYRDEHLVSKSSYSIFRAKLIEYMNKKEINEANRTGIVAYIQNTTHLSRSLIYNFLGALTEGGYIKTQNGKLIEIIRLPENF